MSKNHTGDFNVDMVAFGIDNDGRGPVCLILWLDPHNTRHIHKKRGGVKKPRINHFDIEFSCSSRMSLEDLATLDWGSERVHGDFCHSVSPLVLLAPKRLIDVLSIQ